MLRRFLVVVYLDTPGERLLVLLRHSVHSKVTIIRTPFLLAMIFVQGLSIIFMSTYIYERTRADRDLSASKRKTKAHSSREMLTRSLLFSHITLDLTKYFFDSEVERKTSFRLYHKSLGYAIVTC